MSKLVGFEIKQSPNTTSEIFQDVFCVQCESEENIKYRIHYNSKHETLISIRCAKCDTELTCKLPEEVEK